MNASKRGLCSFLSLLGTLLSLASSDNLEGPSPLVAYVPVSGTATFVCMYDGFDSVTDIWVWTVGDQEVNNLDNTTFVTTGKNSTLRVNVAQHLQQPILVKCELYRRSNLIIFLLASNMNVSEILTYGEPASPGNLSVSVSKEGLLVNWSSPWSPPGVSMNYTVTFLTTKSSVERDYSTAETWLMVSGADLTGADGSPGVCEEYLVRVIAKSPAGVGQAAEKTVPFINFTSNVNFSICNNSNQFVSIHLLKPGSCSENAVKYILFVNSTDGMRESDVDFLGGSDGVVFLNRTVVSVALGATTSNGCSRSEFYHFSEEERANICSWVSTVASVSTLPTFLPSLSLTASPTVLQSEPEMDNYIFLIAASAGAAFLVVMMIVIVVIGSVVCLHQSRKRVTKNMLQGEENTVPTSSGSEKPRLSVISATHPVYQMPQDAFQEYMNEQSQEYIGKGRSRRTSTMSSLTPVKDPCAQLGSEDTDNVYSIPEKSRSLPRGSIVDTSGYSDVPMALKTEIKRRSSRSNGSVKSHLSKTPSLAGKETLCLPPSTCPSPPLPLPNHSNSRTPQDESPVPSLPPSVPPHHFTKPSVPNGISCYNKDLDAQHVYSVPCEEGPTSSSCPPNYPPLPSSSPTLSSPSHAPIYDHVNCL